MGKRWVKSENIIEKERIIMVGFNFEHIFDILQKASFVKILFNIVQTLCIISIS